MFALSRKKKIKIKLKTNDNILEHNNIGNEE